MLWKWTAINDYQPDTLTRLIIIDEGPFLQHIAHKNYIITIITS